MSALLKGFAFAFCIGGGAASIGVATSNPTIVWLAAGVAGFFFAGALALVIYAMDQSL